MARQTHGIIVSLLEDMVLEIREPFTFPHCYCFLEHIYSKLVDGEYDGRAAKQWIETTGQGIHIQSILAMIFQLNMID